MKKDSGSSWATTLYGVVALEAFSVLLIVQPTTRPEIRFRTTAKQGHYVHLLHRKLTLR